MRSTPMERCDFCSEKAVAYQNGATVCGRCGVHRTFGHDVTTSKRVGLIGLFSSGLLAKAMLGSVALAAVGGWAATSALSPPPNSHAPPPALIEHTSEETIVELPPVSIEQPTPTLDEVASTARDQAEKAHELAEAAQTWADCVSDLATEHRGGPFDPKAACGERPTPSDFGLGNGRGSTDAAATSSERKTKPEQTGNGQNDQGSGRENRPSANPGVEDEDGRSDDPKSDDDRNSLDENDDEKPDKDEG